jgi:hypothetical protein
VYNGHCGLKTQIFGFDYLNIRYSSSNMVLGQQQSHPLTIYIAPKTLSSSTPANLFTPGLSVHHATLFPFLLSLQLPASPMASWSKSPLPSLTGLPLRSATMHPLVHCPLVSTLKSSVLNFHLSSPAESAYQIVSGSCSCKPIFVASCCGLRARFFLKVASRKRVDHSARGEPVMGGLVVWDLKREAGRRWGSVMSVVKVSQAYTSTRRNQEVPSGNSLSVSCLLSFSG